MLLWDIEGTDNWVDGKLEGYCRNFEGFRGRISSIGFSPTMDGTHSVHLASRLPCLLTVRQPSEMYAAASLQHFGVLCGL